MYGGGIGGGGEAEVWGRGGDCIVITRTITALRRAAMRAIIILKFQSLQEASEVTTETVSTNHYY